MTEIYPHQVMKDISLMEMNGDERLELSSFNLGQVLRCHVNECIQHVQKDLIGGTHDLLVSACVGQCNLCISCPYKLNAKNSNLQHRYTNEIRDILQLQILWQELKYYAY